MDDHIHRTRLTDTPPLNSMTIVKQTDKHTLGRQIDFLIEADKLKQVFRQSLLTDKSRHENDAEHSWHLALFALVLSDYAPPGADLMRIVKMVVIHDLVEIDCGDTFCYDEAGNVGKVDRERLAAARLFGMLPENLAQEFSSLWEEFEARETPEAKFAAALDRLQPILHNYHTQGAAWQAHGITADRVIERNRHIAEGSPQLWEFAQSLIDDAVVRGYLAPAPDEA